MASTSPPKLQSFVLLANTKVLFYFSALHVIFFFYSSSGKGTMEFALEWPNTQANANHQ